jgi:cupin superfamily acireductone dioxygenase involved in methionine salvage
MKDAMANLRSQLIFDQDKDQLIQMQLAKKDDLIRVQYQSMDLMKKISTDEDYLREAKEVALRILQHTIYSMVDEIKLCNNEVCKKAKLRPFI